MSQILALQELEVELEPHPFPCFSIYASSLTGTAL